MSDIEITLSQLIPKKLMPLQTKAERRLIDAVEKGYLTGIRTKDPEYNEPANSGKWNTEHNVRAELIMWLCEDKKAAKRIHSKGIQVVGIKIFGRLNLRHTEIGFPLIFIKCDFKERIVLLNADINTLHLSGSKTRGIHAHGLKVDGDIFLRNGFSSTDVVNLTSATIGGELDCRRGYFNNPYHFALIANGAKVTGNSLLSDKFSANGTVSFVGAEIGGNLECANATFRKPGGLALNANRIKISGNMTLSEKFSTTGEVSLLGAEIDGNLDFRDGEFNNPKKYALNLQNLIVKKNLWFSDKPPLGHIDLRYAKAGIISDNVKGWPVHGKVLLDGFEYNAFASEDKPKDAEKKLKFLTEKFLALEPFKPQPYEQLAKVFKDMGHEAHAKEILIAKQRALRHQGGLTKRAYVWNKFMGVTVGHGWKPSWAVGWGLLVIFLSTLLFYWADNSKVMQPSKERVYLSADFKESGKPPEIYPKFNPLAYSFDTFIPFVSLHQESYWLPDVSKPSGWWVRSWLWFHIALGWFLSTLAALGFSGIIKKE
jgi:hypothetical protein